MCDIAKRLRDLGGHSINAADRIEAADEIERWRGITGADTDVQNRAAVELRVQFDALKAENTRLKEALGFYAAAANWVDQTVDYGGNLTNVANSARAQDGGRTARAGLAQSKAT